LRAVVLHRSQGKGFPRDGILHCGGTGFELPADGGADEVSPVGEEPLANQQIDLAQIDQADRVDGDIDTLSARIAQIRTWTFVANRPDWLADPEHWQGIARNIENKLSDALHERLTERFVDRRTSVLMRRLRENSVLTTEIGKTGEVIVEGHVIGRLDGFTFAPDAAEAARVLVRGWACAAS